MLQLPGPSQVTASQKKIAVEKRISEVREQLKELEHELRELELVRNMQHGKIMFPDNPDFFNDLYRPTIEKFSMFF